LSIINYSDDVDYTSIGKHVRESIEDCLTELGQPAMKRLSFYDNADEKLLHIADQVSKCIPPDFRRKIRESTSSNLLVVTDDYFMPWELYADGLLDEMWGLKFSVSRIVMEDGLPPEYFPLASSSYSNLRVLLILCPSDDLQEWDLSKEKSIEDDILRVFQEVGIDKGNVRICKYEEANFRNVDNLLRHFDADIIYYFGHVNGDKLKLRHKEPGISELLRKGQWKSTHPLVFVNGCGSVYSSATSAKRSLPSNFIRAGCSAYIGTYWAVDPDTAHRLSIAFFYYLLVQLRTISDALALAKKEVKGWIDKNRSASTIIEEENLPTCPDWAAYCLIGGNSVHRRIINIPKVRLHHGKPSSHYFFYLEETPGGLATEEKVHPINVNIPLENDSEDEINVFIDIISRLSAARLEERGLVVIGTIFETYHDEKEGDDDGVIVGKWLRMKKIEDIISYPRFRIATLSTDFFQWKWFKELLKEKGIDPNKLDVVIFPEISGYYSLIRSNRVDGALVFGAYFHEFSLYDDIAILRDSSVNRYLMEKKGYNPTPLVVFARKETVKKHSLLFQHLLSRIRESVAKFFTSRKDDVDIAKILEMNPRVIQRLARTQRKTDVFIANDTKSKPLFQEYNLIDSLFELQTLPSITDVLPKIEETAEQPSLKKTPDITESITQDRLVDELASMHPKLPPRLVKYIVNLGIDLAFHREEAEYVSMYMIIADKSSIDSFLADSILGESPVLEKETGHIQNLDLESSKQSIISLSPKIAVLVISMDGLVHGVFSLGKKHLTSDCPCGLEEETLVKISDSDSLAIRVNSEENSIKVFCKGRFLFEYHKGRWFRTKFDLVIEKVKKCCKGKKIEEKLLLNAVRLALETSKIVHKKKERAHGGVVAILDYESLKNPMWIDLRESPDKDHEMVVEEINLLDIEKNGEEMIHQLASRVNGDGAVLFNFSGKYIKPGVYFVPPPLAVNRVKLKNPWLRSNDIGTKHVNSAAITSVVDGVTIVVSKSGPITIFTDGNTVARFEY